MSPSMYGRIDHEKYLLGLKRCRNFFVRTHGGISNRAGFEHLGMTFKGMRSRFIPFVFNNEQSYLIEFGADGVGRVWMDGALVIDSNRDPLPMATVSDAGLYYGTSVICLKFDAAPEEEEPPFLALNDELYFPFFSDSVSDYPHARLQGQTLWVSADGGNGTDYWLSTPYTQLDYCATDQLGDLSHAEHPFQFVYHFAHPYALADLPLLKFSQSADVLTLTHPGYAPQRLTRSAHDVWTMAQATFAPTVQPPTNLTGRCISKDGYNTKARYRVTAVDDVTFEESTPVEVEFKSHRSIGLPSLNVYTELSAQPHPLIENKLSWTRNTASSVLRYNVYRSIANSAFTYVGSAAGDEDPSLDEDTLVIDTITASSHTTKRIKVKTKGDHGLITGDAIEIQGILSADTTGDTLADVLNGNIFKVKKIDNNDLYLRVLDANDYIEYPSGATSYQRIDVTSWSTATPCVVAIPVGDNTSGLDVGTPLHVDDATGADAADVNGLFWYVATIDNTSSTTVITMTIADAAGEVLDGAGKVITGGKISTAFGNATDVRYNFTDRVPMTQTAISVLDPPPPMTPINPFNNTGDYPECSGYHEQRQWFGGTLNNPNTLWATQIALYDNMNRKSPVAATDAVIITLPSTRVNPVYHILSMRDLLVFTGDGDWWIDSTDGAINAATARAQQQSYTGCSREVPPVPVGHRVLFAEDRGKGVRELSYNERGRGMQSIDRTVYARHLFDNKQLTSLAYQSLPFAIVWATNADGELLAMSYEADQEVYAWSVHSRVGAKFIQAVTLTEDDDDNLYTVVEVVGSFHPDQKAYMLEKMHNRQFDGIAGARFADSWSVRTFTVGGEGGGD